MGQRQSTKPLSFADYWSETRVNVTNFTFAWEIQNFSHCPKQNGEVLWSGMFSGQDSKDKWRLQIYVRGKGPLNKDYVSLYLVLVERGRNEVTAKYLFSLKNHKGASLFQRGGEYQRNFKSAGCFWGWPNFIERSYLLDPYNGLLPDDKLTIVCSLDVAGDTVTGKLPMFSSRLGKDLAIPYPNHEFGDCLTLSVGGKQLNAHKAVLSAHSPVFSAMFEHDTKESQTGHIDIEDTEPEVMKELLQFLYTGSSPNLASMAGGLLVLADKYQVQPLKLFCEEAMCDQMSVENACAVLVQADRVSAVRLKSFAVKFMIAQAAEVSRTQGFKSLVEQYPQLHIETFQKMAASRFKLPK